MSETILGISAYYHDSAAVLLIDGKIIGAVQEERFSRIKHDESFPKKAIKYLLQMAGIDEIDTIAFYEKPYIKFERLLETYHAFAPFGYKSFLSAIPVWINEKLFMKKMLKDELGKLGLDLKKINLLFPEHHLSHSASAFYPSPFNEAAILTIDGVGEWATTTIGFGNGNDIEILRELHFPHSLGLLYSAFTYYCGFKVNSGEYKLMGLAPYGNANSDQTKSYKKIILDELIDIREDGSFLLNMKYFNFAAGLTMCKNKLWESLFDIPKREPETDLSQSYMNMALAIQQVTEDIVLRLAKTAKTLTKSKNLVMAGGVALNCVANGKLLRKKIFDDIWIQPASGDAGGALGSALAAWHISKGKKRVANNNNDIMEGSYLGPEFSTSDIIRSVKKFKAAFKKYDDFDILCNDISELLIQGNVIGWFQGRMEYGPRALGNRSILGNPKSPEMQKKIKFKN